ncbi:VOC family protein [Gimesia aquarii]|uniref:Glyoxalase-like domain protein n=1 Tax=Gimesia aquarii TaxID=2527964 RepID=A0A517VSP6_9PLAN|nr:VOC family protein [Gimesia aquarii]QDT96038.1 Glyoxalase-like domain protein [Gimesia aquarii]
MQPQPMIAVNDVPASSNWYQRLLNCQSGHGGDEYERLIADSGELVLQLHHWDAHEHPYMGDPELPRGNGVLLWFRVEGFEDAVARANAMSAQVLDGPMVNPNANHREIWIKDPDGYVVVLAGPTGDL